MNAVISLCLRLGLPWMCLQPQLSFVLTSPGPSPVLLPAIFLNDLAVYKKVAIEQQSSTFLAQGTRGRQCSHIMGWGCYRTIQVHSVSHALYFYYCTVIHNEIIVQLIRIQNQLGLWAYFPATRWFHLGTIGDCSGPSNDKQLSLEDVLDHPWPPW